MKSEENFNQYKKTESLALEIANQLIQQDVKLENVEIALLVAVYDLHQKRGIAVETTRKIILGHLDTITPFYQNKFE